MQNKLKVEKHIHWKINSGTCSFWWDNWLGVGPLANFSNDSHRFNNTTVADFLNEGQWTVEKVLQQTAHIMVANILSTQFQYQQGVSDQAMWKLNTDWKFTCSSAWNDLRDTIDHIFNTGHFAAHIWRFFAMHAGINQDHTNLTSLIMRWWSTKYNNEYAVYKDNYKLLATIFPYIKWFSNWRELIKQVEKCFHDIKIHKVQWQRPPEQWVKLNTDGSALSNTGRIGAGGIIRDHRGEMILAFATPLGEGTNNQAEVRAAIFGMTWLLQIGYRNLMDLIRQASRFKCKHTYREANTVADLLSKESHKMTSPSMYNSSQQLPKEAKGYYQLDIMEMASFRRRKIKRIKEPP
ncbi:hypothetical protein R3W88_033425 [Solanum pinnatisectum]|uniref:RNase H type-1 domain-containing protein n=1 Tax=Solanum pinnatisectum TaxID=50273 RepID=A0AAV9K110_9SOLN|nr:hypothetical protein R3W88_033425 [Solanum pinnatisectum]